MNPWPFVIAAYGIALGGTALLLFWAMRAMRKAEKQADNLKRRP